jgi:hypothetical protein
MKKSLALGALASIALLAGSLTACGSGDDSASGGSGDDYCGQIKTLQSSVSSLDFTQLDDASFAKLQDSLHGIEDSAPSDIKGDWTTLNSAIDQLNTILSDAGLTFDDLKAIQTDPSHLPDGVDLSTLQGLAKKLNDFASNTSFQDASDNIQANVKDVCHIDLDATDGSSTGGS